MKKTVYLTAIAVTVLIVDRLTKLVSTTAFLDGAEAYRGASAASRWQSPTCHTRTP